MTIVENRLRTCQCCGEHFQPAEVGEFRRLLEDAEFWSDWGDHYGPCYQDWKDDLDDEVEMMPTEREDRRIIVGGRVIWDPS